MPVAPTSLLSRVLFVSLGVLSLLSATPQAQADDKVLRVGTLKLIHGITPYFYEKFAPSGYTVEVIPFESPTDGKNAVLTGTVDTCIHGIAAFLLGAAAGEPVVIVARRDQSRHGDRRRRQIRHQDDQGSQRQTRCHLPGLDAGGGDPRAAQGRGYVDIGYSTDPAFVQRHGRRAGPRRYRCLCRRRTRPWHQPCEWQPAG